MRRRRMNGVDAAWLRMETPDNLMMVTGLFFFGHPVPYAALRAHVAQRLLRWPRFRERVEEPSFGRPDWVEVEPDLTQHAIETTLPDPGDKAALQRCVGELMSTQLDRSRPLWQMHVIQNAAGGTALVMRVHHAVGDGIALMEVVLSLTDHDETEQQVPRPPGHGKGALAALRLVGDLFVSTARVLFRGADPRTLLRGDLVVEKRCAWTPNLSLDEIKAAKNALGATVNDVLLACMAGALRRYVLARGGAADRDIRAAVPVNLRPRRQMGKLGNYFGLVFLKLPVSVEDPVERVRILHRRMESLKRSTEPFVALVILRLLGFLPWFLQRVIVKIIGRKATSVMTNVPGPAVPLSIGGERIESFLYWVPQSARMGLGVSILSYAGGVRVGVAADAHLVPDPDALVAAFEDELRDVEETAARLN